MSHFAELDENNQVIRVVVGDNSMPNEGKDWVEENLGGRWIQTSFNANFRKNFGIPGYTYDEERDAFIPPQPYASWVLDELTCWWVAPIAKPEGDFVWDEDSVSWVEVTE